MAATLVVVRVLMAVALAPFRGERGPASWLSPVADLLAVVCLTLSALPRWPCWRGGRYPLSLDWVVIDGASNGS